MRHLFYILLLSLSCFGLMAQSLVPSVINAAGDMASVGSGSLTIDVMYSIGEPCMTTVANSGHVLTQGFLQPELLVKEGLVINKKLSHESCLGKSDGAIQLTASVNGAAQGSYVIEYNWLPTGPCPTATCNALTALVPGSYTVIVVAKTLGGTEIDRDTLSPLVVNPSNFPCEIQVYTGFTPNGDGKNDTWVIDHIDQFPNKVSIFNRWGEVIQEIKNYDNVTNYWDGTEKRTKKKVATGTYFYVIELQTGATMKGWVEVTAVN